jgi:DNA-binding transcriptional MerR regulator
VNGKKTYYSISEVCSQIGLEPHVLRYWESEFPQLHPKKNRAGNRAYRDKDIEVIRYIKYLLYEEQFTIPGAKKKLAESKDFDSEQMKLELPAESSEGTDGADGSTRKKSSGHSKPAGGEVIDEVKKGLKEVLSLLHA